MAEYYPLLSRAVAGLREGPPEARRAIYDRAKQALIGQLRKTEPPVPEADIVRESLALDDAIARVEAELAPPVPILPADARMPAERVAAPRVPAQQSASPAIRPATSVPPPGGTLRPTLPSRPAAPLGVPPRSTLPPLRPSVNRPVLPSNGTTLRAGQPGGAAPPLPGESPPAPAVPEPPKRQPEPDPSPSMSLPSAPKLGVEPKTGDPVTQRSTDVAAVAAGVRRETRATATDFDAPLPGPGRTRDDTRPAAPRAVERQNPNPRVWIVAAVALIIVASIAFAAWKLRDRPEQLARVPAAVVSTPAPQAGKIVERADGTTSDSSASDPDTAASGGVTTAPSTNAGQDTQSAATAPNAAGAPQPAGDQAIPVSYKAAILIDAPDDPQKVKTFVGTVVWRTESISQGQGQPLGTAVRADIDIPEAKVQLVMQFSRNTEAQFPASHTIELKFAVAADSPLSGIKQISVPQLRREDMPTGDPLAGVPVTITDNYFLVGLTRGGDYETRNLDLIRSRGWFDIPLLLNTGKPAKITFEKGASGDRIFNDVIQSWK